ncbi:MAG: cytochrome c biogenesis protein CcsA [Ideonella sp.]|jgi:ABC-type uncharacterized transport system permease subunit|nr:cytochrome c biogenesis protein CcsA [Ideonella sp.]
MILSFASPATSMPLLLAAAAVLGYVAAALGSTAESARWPTLALSLAWVMHGLWLALDIAGLGRGEPGVRLGFGPVLSLAVWLIVAVHAVESRFVPLPAVRRWLAVGGAIAMVLAWAFPGELRVMASRWGPFHWVLGVASYGLFGAAVFHATMLDSAERQMRLRAAARGPFGMPLLRLERLTFRFVEAGFAVLTLALLLGAATTSQWRWDHKTVLSLLSWAVFAALLAGRQFRGWRGQRATRWLYAGTLLLLLGYVGSRFVFEVLLGRTAT